MQSSKLFRLLGGLTSSEIRWLHKFIKSPFYNTNNQVLQLFEYLKKYYPNLDSPKLTKELVHQYLFPKEKYTAQRMRKLMHELATLVEDFMVAQHLKTNQFERKRVLTQELGKRNLYELFKKNTNEIVVELGNLPHRDKNYYLQKYLLNYQYFGHPQTNPQESFLPKLLALSENLDGFYFLQKLQLNSVLESGKEIFKVDQQLPFLEEVQAEIKKRNLVTNPTLNLYLLVNQLFRNKNHEDFFIELQQQFLTQKENLSVIDRETILKYLINYCTHQLNKGADKYVSLQYQLYKIALSDASFSKKKLITEHTFTNIIWSGTFLKEFQFVEQFIEEYQQFLSADRRLEIVTLCKAYLHFHKKNYAETIDLLSKETFAKLVDKLRAKTLLIKSYFELYQKDESYFNLVMTQLGNFERRIHRNAHISIKRKEGYLNFIKFLKKTVELNLKNTNLDNLKNEILKTNNVSNKPWLLAKVSIA